MSVTCFIPRASTSTRGSPPSIQTISNRSLAILPEMVPSPIRSMIAASWDADTGDAAMSQALFVEASEQFVDHPVGGNFPIASRGRKTGQNRLVEVGALMLVDKHGCVIRCQAEIRDEPCLLLVRQFRQIGLQRIDEGLRKLQRQQVGVGEIAVVVRLFLGAHRAGLALIRIEQPGLLINAAAILENADLTPSLMFDRLTDEADGVDVLDLAARTEGLAWPAHRDIDVGAEAAFLHVTVAGGEIAQDRPQFRHIGLGLFG